MNSHFINGQWVESQGAEFASHNPATGEVVWRGNEADAATVDRAVKAAQAAFDSWRSLSLDKRIECLQKFKGLVTQENEMLARAISEEEGKPVWEALTEVASMINKVDISIKAYKTRCPDTETMQGDKKLIVKHRAHGVMAVIGPFNFPGHLPNGHIVPALLAGNAVVFKPSDHTPHVAELTVKLWAQCGLPPGVLNLVQGGSKTAVSLCQHPNIDGVLFTGSWTTGKRLAEMMAAKPYKILALEMGGNNPLVLGTIGDVEAAADMAIYSAFVTSGERCTCARRLIVPANTEGDVFLQIMADKVKKLRVGAYTDIPEPFMGPLINKEAAQKLLDAYKRLEAAGGKALVPMKKLDRGDTFLSPGVIDITDVSSKPDEELFGPLLLVIRTPDFDASIREANNTQYGLTAGLLSDSSEEFDRFYQHIRAGVVNWNTPLTGATSYAPFGGLGQSGNNRPSAYYAADYCAYPVASNIAPKMNAHGLLRS